MNKKNSFLVATTRACYDNYVCQTEQWTELVGQYVRYNRWKQEARGTTQGQASNKVCA